MITIGEWTIFGAAAVAGLAWGKVCELAQRRENERAHFAGLVERGVLS